MALAKFTLREVRNRPGRAILTLLSVVIGVALVVSVSVAASTTRRAMQGILDAVNGESALEVVSEAGAAFDAALLKKIQQVHGVEKAVPLIRQRSILYPGNRQQVGVLALGIDPTRDAAVRGLELVTGRMLTADDEGLLVDRQLAERFKLEVGKQLKLMTRGGLEKFEIVGVVNPRRDTGGELMIYLPLPAAQESLRRTGQIDSVQIVPGREAALEKLKQDVSKVLPQGLLVLLTNDRASQAVEMLRSTEMGVLLASVFSWAVALLIVLNTFQMNVVERRRQLAALRAIGATRRQIIWLVCREGLVMGLLGTVLGIGLGLAGAWLLSLATAQVLEMAQPALTITWLPVVLALVVGPAIAALGAVFPAWQAGRVSPLEGLRAVPQSDLQAPPWGLTALGLLIVGGNSALLAASMTNHLPMVVAVGAALGLLVGLIFLLPVSLKPLARTVAGSLGWLWGVEGRLAQGQVVRRRGRATLTVAVLFLAISFGTLLAHSIVDSVRDVQRWGRVASQGDFFVRAMMPDMKIGLASKMPKAVGDEIEAVKGIAALQTVTFSTIKVKDLNSTILSGNFDDQGEDRFKFDLVSGDPKGVYAALKRGEVLIGTVLGVRANLKIGDEIALQSGKVRVAGMVNDYLTGGLTMYMDRQVAKDMLGIDGVDVYVLWAERGQHAAVEQQLKQITDEHGILLQTHQEMLGLIDSRMNGVVACLWSLLVVVFVVAAFGVVNTLTMNVIEQTRELGLLRIVAMTRRQVRKMILAQAAILALIGLAPGAVAGLGVAYVINRSMAPVMGHPIAFVVHTSVVVGCFVTAFAIVLIAAWFPATRAARLKLAEAIQYQ